LTNVGDRVLPSTVAAGMPYLIFCFLCNHKLQTEIYKRAFNDCLAIKISNRVHTCIFLL
jgi:hypothetical protein